MGVVATRNHLEGREIILAIEVFGIFAILGWLDLETMGPTSILCVYKTSVKGPESGRAWIYKKSRGSLNEQL